MTRLVSLDFETTGTVSGWPNEPWQLGCVEIADGEPVAASCWETYFRIPADRPFSPRAPGRWAQIRAELAAAPSFSEMWPEISSRVVGVPLIAHNAATERTILVKSAPLVVRHAPHRASPMAHAEIVHVRRPRAHIRTSNPR